MAHWPPSRNALHGVTREVGYVTQQPNLMPWRTLIDNPFAMLLVMMALMMGLNALMVLPERYALRWRAEMTATIQPY